MPSRKNGMTNCIGAVFTAIVFIFFAALPQASNAQATTYESPVITGTITLIYDDTQCDPPRFIVDGNCQEPAEGGGEGGGGSAENTGTGGTGPKNNTANDGAKDTEIASDPNDLGVEPPPYVISLAPESLRAGRQRIDYGREVITAEGGVRPYRFQVTDGALPDGLRLSPEGALTGTPSAVGTFAFTVTATDWDKISGDQPYLIKVTAPGSIKAPQVVDTVVIESCLPEYVLDDGTCGEPTPETTVVAISDPAGNSPTNTEPVISDDPGNTAIPIEPLPGPRIVISPDTLRAGRQRVDYGTEVLTAEGGMPPYRFDVIDGTLPQGLTLSPAGALTGTPTDVGRSSFVVAVTDWEKSSGVTAYQIEITAPGTIKAPKAVDTVIVEYCPSERQLADGTCKEEVAEEPATPLSVTPDVLKDGIVGVPFGPVDIQLSGGQTPYSVIASSALPEGLTWIYLEAADGVRLSGVPAEAADVKQALIFNAVDGLGAVMSKVYALRVTAPLAIGPDSLPVGSVGTPYGPVDVTVSGGVPPYTIVTQGDLTTGMTKRDLPDGSGLQIGGTPALAGVTDPALTVTAIDSAGAVVGRAYALTIEQAGCPDPAMYIFAGECICPESMKNVGGMCAEPIEISPLALSDGSINTPYIPVQFIATGVGPYTFNLADEDGGLPPGMELSQSGRLSGTPELAGRFGFVVEVWRGDTMVGDQVYEVNVSDVVIEIAPAELPGGNVASFYSSQLDASGGDAPYSFQFAGQGPDWLGLSSSGLLSGVPSREGPASFSVRATDANGSRSQDTGYTITIDAETCPFPGMISSLNADTPQACECKPTLFPFAKGEGCGPCADGQKPLGGTCPPALKPITKPSVQTKASCTGGMVLNSKGVCTCPNSKPDLVNGQCKAKPKPPPTAKPKTTAKGPSCLPGEVAFATKEALRAHLRANGETKGFTRTLNGKNIYCGPPGKTRQQPPPAPPPQQAPQRNQCNMVVGLAYCLARGLNFDAGICDCVAPPPQYDAPPQYDEGDNYDEGEDYPEGDNYDYGGDAEGDGYYYQEPGADGQDD